MWFIVLKLLKFGFSQAKKHKAKKNQQHDICLNNPQGVPPEQQYQFNAPPPPPTSSMNLRSVYTVNGTRNPAKAFMEGFLRFLQFVFGLTVIGLYGRDLHHQSNHNVAGVKAKWVYAVVAAFLATTTALVHLVLPFVLKERPLAVRTRAHIPLFAWECILCILWLTMFGIFGKMYIGVYVKDDDAVTRMRHAVWVDLVNLGMWATTALWAFLRWWKGRRTGAAGGEDAEKAIPL